MRIKKDYQLRIVSALVLLTMILTTFMVGNSGSVVAQDTPPGEPEVLEVEQVNPYFTVERLRMADGAELEKAIIGGPPEPPEGYEAEYPSLIEGEPSGIAHASFPSYDWVFGCSAVSGAMIAGYYDRNGYPNMYTGPTAGGVMPLTDTSWATWSDGFETYPNNPLIASHKGIDGRTIKGSIDDYWVKYGSSASDPYITGSWTQHTWGTAIGDYMKTSQSAYSNTDGSTSFYSYTTSADKLTCTDMVGYSIHTKDGTYGRKLFYEARGYTVTDCYAQRTYNDQAGGFSLANLKAEIDAGHPVFINVTGHSMVAYGYSGTTVYIRDTWDSNPNNIKSMVWDADPTYKGMTLYAVSIVKLKSSTPVVVPTPIAPSGTIAVKQPTYKWSKIKNATHYNIQLYKGSTKVYDKTFETPSCTATTCTKKFSINLADANYKWRIRAKVSGSWRAWSVYKNFTVQTTVTGWFSPFTDNANGWKKVSGWWKLVPNGYYQTNGLAGTGSSIAHDNYYKTLTYEVRMKRVGDVDSANRIMVRGIPYPLGSTNWWDDGYVFQYTNNGSFSVYKTVNGVNTALKPWTDTSAILNGKFNKLKVTASGSTLKFYINGTLVWSGSDTSLTTGKVGIGMYKSASGWSPLQVDWAKLTASVSSMEGEEPVVEQGISYPDWTDMNVSPGGD